MVLSVVACVNAA